MPPRYILSHGLGGQGLDILSKGFWSALAAAAGAPTTDALRESIMDSVRAALAGVSVAAGYRTNPSLVTRVRPWTVGSRISNVPLLYIVDHGQTGEQQPCGTYLYTLSVRVIGLLELDPWVTTSARQSDLASDVIEAVLSDPYRGSQAISSLYKGDYFTSPSFDGVAAVETAFDVIYEGEHT